MIVIKYMDPHTECEETLRCPGLGSLCWVLDSMGCDTSNVDDDYKVTSISLEEPNNGIDRFEDSSKLKLKDPQVGGTHYEYLAIDPFSYCHYNKIGPCEFSAIKYLTRHGSKNGAQDLEKAIQSIQRLIQMEYPDHKSKPEAPRE